MSGFNWFYLPTAFVLGSLHGLEPGHSKTMMAAFLIAVRGTVRQAVLLGVSATISHTAVIWLLAALALQFQNRFRSEQAEPWLHLTSGLLIWGMAAWFLTVQVRQWRAARSDHDDAHHQHDQVHVDGHDGEEHDAHARAHIAEIQQRFISGRATNTQVVLFGLTGGLLPCPGALTVLLLCLQAGETALGFGIVLAFSVGLAATLVAVGAAAAWGAQRATARMQGLLRWAPYAPFLSTALLFALGAWLVAFGAIHLLLSPELAGMFRV